MKPTFTGVVFDFNGMLFWDTKLHNRAWNRFLEKYGLYLSDDDFFHLIHGKNNKEIFQILFDNKLSDSEMFE